jgi:putative FmdB family regulatory protein
MPTYQYRCKDCGYEFEEFQSIVDDPLTVCPKCSGLVHRVISGGVGLIFKGSGFYITDYRDSKYKADAAKDKPASSGDSSSKTSESPPKGKQKHGATSTT